MPVLSILSEVDKYHVDKFSDFFDRVDIFCVIYIGGCADVIVRVINLVVVEDTMTEFEDNRQLCYGVACYSGIISEI